VVGPELLFHVIRYAVARGVGLVGQGEVGLQVLPDDAVKRSSLGAPPPVGLGMGAGRWPGWWCRPTGFSVNSPGLCGHCRPPESRGESCSVSTSRTAIERYVERRLAPSSTQREDSRRSPAISAAQGSLRTSSASSALCAGAARDCRCARSSTRSSASCSTQRVGTWSASTR